MFPFGIRVQLPALALFLVLIPALAYRHVESLEQQLVLGQKTALNDRAAALATALQERPSLFREMPSVDNIEPGRDLYAYRLDMAVRLDGRDNDWEKHLPHALNYGQDHIIDIQRAYTEASLNFDHILGVQGDSLYAFFRVTDDNVVYREVNGISVHRNDNVQIALGDGPRYTVAAVQPGEVAAYLVAPRNRGGRALSLENRIRGYWLATGNGYNLELEIPLAMIGTRLGFAIADVDDQTSRDLVAVVGTSDLFERGGPGTVLVPSAGIEQRLRELGGGRSRVQVLDTHGRVVARRGNIETATGIWRTSSPYDAAGWLHALESRILAPLYDDVLPLPARGFAGPLDDPARLQGEHIASALSGTPAIGMSSLPNNDAAILSAAHPIRIDDKVAGVVVVEQTTSGARELRTLATRRLLTMSAIVTLTGGLLLLVAGSIISRRVRRLRQQIEESVDPQGRVRGELPGTRSRDEIGDLARSFSDIIRRLRQYNTYLEDMARRLAHELRTPVTVVRSSLDNLSIQKLDDDSRVYVERANEGVQRLSSILNSMSEATRLEQVLDVSDQEIFDLAEVIKGCIQGYEIAYPGQTFRLSIEANDVKINGIPDLIAQMLDKLVNNAVEFSYEGVAVKIRLTVEQGDAFVRVVNDGPSLPGDMQARLFDSMVSVRTGSTESSHLGLGLYIARIIAEFHGGSIAAANREDAEGVIVTVRLPIMRLTGRRP